jgi:hypothetical protein
MSHSIICYFEDACCHPSRPGLRSLPVDADKGGLYGMSSIKLPSGAFDFTDVSLFERVIERNISILSCQNTNRFLQQRNVIMTKWKQIWLE